MTARYGHCNSSCTQSVLSVRECTGAVCRGRTGFKAGSPGSKVPVKPSLAMVVRARCGGDSDWDGQQPVQQVAMLEEVG